MENIISLTYRYKLKFWLLFIVWGTACETAVIGAMIRNLPDLLAGNFGILDYLGIAFVLIVLFPFGVLSFAVPLSAKIIIAPEGVEFHTIVAVTKAKWSDLSIGFIQTQSGLAQTLVASKSDITLKRWAKYLPWDVARGIRELGIPFSEFGAFTSQSLFASIGQYAPHLNIHE